LRAAALAALLVLGAATLADRVSARARAPASHVVVIMMENKEAGDVIGNPAASYENALARRYGLATESYAITHPSLPNYLAITSGSTDGISSDCTACTVNAGNIVDQLGAAGVTWRAYLEGVPTACFIGAGAGEYAKKHNPFIYYNDVSRSRSRCSNLVGIGALGSDLRAHRLPTFVWITPNLCDDTHDCGVGSGDSFLSRIVPPLLKALGPQGFLVLTWDEGVSSQGCCGGAAHGGRVATIVAGPLVIAGARTASPIDHYGVLATIERALRLPLLGAAADPRNGSLAPLFRSQPHVR
jgi:phospholipase C